MTSWDLVTLFTKERETKQFYKKKPWWRPIWKRCEYGGFLFNCCWWISDGIWCPHFLFSFDILTRAIVKMIKIFCVTQDFPHWPGVKNINILFLSFYDINRFDSKVNMHDSVFYPQQGRGTPLKYVCRKCMFFGGDMRQPEIRLRL